MIYCDQMCIKLWCEIFCCVKNIYGIFSVTIGILFISGCASGSNNSHASEPPKSCNYSFDNTPPNAICQLYYSNKLNICDRKIMKTMTDRQLQLTPQSMCGLPLTERSPASTNCNMNFYSMPAEQVCDSYWNNKDRQCDERMRETFKSRNIQMHPRAVCGIPNSTPNSITSNQCTDDFRKLSSIDICSGFWSNKNTVCDSKMREELQRRGSNVYPREMCGQSVSPKESAPTVSVPRLCSIENIPSFVAKNSNDLCKILYSKDGCSRLAKISLQGRSISIGNSVASCGGIERNECGALMKRFESSGDKVAAACTLRNDKTSLVGLKCRSEISGFLLNNNRSSGAGAAVCGQPLSSAELELHRKSQ